MTGAAVLRPATLADSNLLFAWVNRPDSLAAKALTKAPISRDEHEAWFATRLGDPNTAINMIEFEGRAVGQVRMQKGDDAAYAVDIYVEPECRGRGLAAWAIKQAMAALPEQGDDVRIKAQVKDGNAPSVALFKSIGFSETGRENGLITFMKRGAP